MPRLEISGELEIAVKNIMKNDYVKKAIENKTFGKGTIDGYTVEAIDETKIFGSNNK